METTSINLTIGDLVCVKKGIRDPDTDVNMDGWQGKITEIEKNELGQTLICLSWDSMTLRNMPIFFLEKSEEGG